MSAVSYVDASALVKLIIEEAGSMSMERWFIESERVLTSVVGVVETRRAVARRQHESVRVDLVIGAVETIELTASIMDGAASLRPAALRTLDAIHLATALAATPGIDAFVTYDDRLAEAARAAGLRVVRPA